MVSGARSVCIVLFLTVLLSLSSAHADPVVPAPGAIPVWLPIQPPATIDVTQGNNCTLKWCDHNGAYGYAWDFIVGPSNFVITAAHSGTILALDDTSVVTCDGFNHEKVPTYQILKKCWAYANFILIADDPGGSHDETTATLYMHLLPNSLRTYLPNGKLLAAGEHVNAGDPLALAGTTGYSTGTHLHFQVERLPSLGSNPFTGWWFTPTVPATFNDPEVLAKRPDGVPQMGDRFPLGIAPPIPTATATPVPTATPIPTPTPIGGGSGSCGTTTTGLISAGVFIFFFSRRKRRREHSARRHEADQPPPGSENAHSPPEALPDAMG